MRESQAKKTKDGDTETNNTRLRYETNLKQPRDDHAQSRVVTPTSICVVKPSEHEMYQGANEGVVCISSSSVPRLNNETAVK